jgi:hypothetical protein
MGYLQSVLRILIRDPVHYCPLGPGSGIGFFRIPDLGSWITNPYYRELQGNFWAQITIIFCEVTELAQIFFSRYPIYLWLQKQVG